MTSRKKIGFRWELDGVIVELLGPDGMAKSPKRVGGCETIAIPGGTQALQRAETVSVELDGFKPTRVNRPDLMGAILLKARVVSKQRDKFQSDRQDFVRLLTFVEDPRELAQRAGLKRTEKNWLRKVRPLAGLDSRSLVGQLTTDEIVQARQALDLFLV